MKIRQNKYVMFFSESVWTQEEVLAELWILGNDDPLGDGAQILFNKEITESIRSNCTRIVRW